MTFYRRSRNAGGTFFFTVVTYRRRLLFDHAESRRILREIVQGVRTRYPFTIDAWVVLPDHMHCLWTLPEECGDFSLRWNLIKSGFSKKAKSLFHVDAWMNASKRKHRELTIWQRRFWEHRIRNEKEYRIYMDYIHYNPVKHGWVDRVADWPFSTFHRYTETGIYPQEWGDQANEIFLPAPME